MEFGAVFARDVNDSIMSSSSEAILDMHERMANDLATRAEFRDIYHVPDTEEHALFQ